MDRLGKTKKGKVGAKRPAVRKPPKDSVGKPRDLEKRLAAALEQQMATSEILRVISSSPTDVQPVFATILRRAVQLSGALRGGVFHFDGELLHLVAHHIQPPEALASLERTYPM